mgnify:FL=1
MNIESVAVLIGVTLVTISVVYVMYKINQETFNY